MKSAGAVIVILVHALDRRSLAVGDEKEEKEARELAREMHIKLYTLPRRAEGAALQWLVLAGPYAGQRQTGFSSWPLLRGERV